MPRDSALSSGPSRSSTPSTASRPNITVDTAGLPPPSSRVLISAAKPGDPAPTKNSISLRYQPMTMVDPIPAPPPPLPRKKILDPPMTSSRHKPSPSRGFRSKPCPGSRNMLEAIPNSWASASRPSDLRPNPPAPQTCKAPSRPSPTPPLPPQAAPTHSNTVRLRSKSADRVGSKTSVTGPRSPKRGLVVQPTPKRLSLGMVMDTAKLVSTPPTSDLNSSISVPLSKSILPPTTTNTVPIRSLPSSPNGPSCIARLPISGSHYKRELSPSPVSPIHRSTSPISSLPVLGPKPLPAPPSTSIQPSISPSPHRPVLHLNPTIPLSPFAPSPPSLPSSWSPKSPIQNASTSPTTATTTTSGTASSFMSALSSNLSKYEELSHEKREKNGELSVSSGHFDHQHHHQEPQVQDKSIPDTVTTTLPSSPPPLPPPSSPIEEDDEEEEEEEEEERLDQLDNLDAYDWTLDEEHYDDQLFRIPITPTSTLNGGEDPILEVFVDNLYCGERERSPSPITYARPEGSDYSDEEESTNVGRRRRGRRKTAEEEGQKDSLGASGGLDRITSRTSPNGNRRNHRQNNSSSHPQSSAMSYHSDDSSLYFTGNRRRRRREQLRSYRYSFRPPVSPTSAAAASAVSSNTLAGFSSKAMRNGGTATAAAGGKGRTKVFRSPSPIAYARRRSLDGLYDCNSEADEMDEGCGDGVGDVVFAQQEDGLISGWWEMREMKRRTMQPRSFMHSYSKPPDVTSFSEERERVLEREKEMRERGRKKERTLIPVPLVGYHGNNNNNNKERSKDKDGKEKFIRTRKGSRGLLDELAAVAARNSNAARKTNGNNHNTTPRTSGGSPPPSFPPLPPLPFHSKERDRDEKEKEKEKEKKRKWVWELSKSDSSSKDKLVCPGGDGSITASSSENVLVLDIGNGNSSEGYEGWNAEWLDDEDFCGGIRRGGKKQRHSLNGLEFI